MIYMRLPRRSILPSGQQNPNDKIPSKLHSPPLEPLSSLPPPPHLALSRLRQPGNRLRERRAQLPICQVANVPLEHGIDSQAWRLTLATRSGNLQQRVHGFVGPADADAQRVRQEEVLEGVLQVLAHELVAHAREGDLVDPGGVGFEELGGARAEPFWEAVVILARGADLPLWCGEGQS